jgi:hypothetical protein
MSDFGRQAKLVRHALLAQLPLDEGPMSFLTQFRSFFVSLFGEAAVCDELNGFLKAHRIVNVDHTTP